MFKTIITPVSPYFSAVFEAGQKCTLLDIEKADRKLIDLLFIEYTSLFFIR